MASGRWPDCQLADEGRFSLVRMPADCPRVVCNDRPQRTAAHSDLLFYKLSTGTDPASCHPRQNAPLRTWSPQATSHLWQFTHQDGLFPVIRVPIDTVVKMMNTFFLMTHHIPCSEISVFYCCTETVSNHFFASDLDCLKKLIRHMFTMFFIQLSPECFLTI